MRRAKIVATIGPATESTEQITALVEAGMDVARLNRSHGETEVHEMVYHRVRQAAADTGKNVAILVDLQGPKIRLGRFAEGQATLDVGQQFTITTRDVPGDQNIASTTFMGLPGDCKPGDILLIDDGRVAVRVVESGETDVLTEVVTGGIVSNNKGINLPGVAVSVPALSEKDKEDLRWALRIGADYIALSFVRSAADYQDVAQIMEEEGRKVPVIAKIEKPQAIENLEGIVDAFDAIMVARGDLGVELPLEEVPLVQKKAIQLARANAKPVIVATQVLESMISAPTPTRAETSDCANAVLDGTDAVMLSGETSVGQYPILAVQTMARIIQSTESNGADLIAPFPSNPRTRGGAITKAAAEVGESVGAKLLVTFTQSGDSAKRMSRLRSPLKLLAFTPLESTRRTLALSWGVNAYKTPEVGSVDEMVAQVDDILLDANEVEVGDYVVIVSGAPVGIPGTTNSMTVHKVGQKKAKYSN